MKGKWIKWMGLLVVTALLCGTAWSSEVYRLMDGTRYWGRVANFNEQGVVFLLDSGEFSRRVPWSKFDQETLKKMAKDPKLRPFAEPFIEIPPEKRPKPKPIVVHEPPRVPLPQNMVGVSQLFVTPIGLFMLMVVYLANLLAAYEIAFYRNRPVGLVCGLSAVFPGIAPLAFLVSPTMESEAVPAEMPAEPAPATPSAGASGGATSQQVLPSSGLRLATAKKESGAQPAVQRKVYDRSQYTFDRRFIETTFQDFFRMVPPPSIRDMVLVIKTPKREIVAKRISRMTGTDMYVIPAQLGAQEVRIRLGEISQIIIRHKDDRS